MQCLDAQTGYTAVIANLSGAARRTADYGAFVQFVRDHEAGSDLFSLTRYIARLLRAEVEVPRPPLGAADAVTLMTIHRAKGLEWPVVVLADLDYVLPPPKTPLLMDSTFGVAFGVAFAATDDDSEQPCLYTLLKRRHTLREAAQLRHVLYVGLTRARDRLILSAANSKGGALNVLLPCLEAAGFTPTAVPHTHESAIYPQHPQPDTPQLADADLGHLWQAPVTALAVAGHVEAKMTVTPGRTLSSDAWADISELFVMVEQEHWLPLLETLRAGGVPAPDIERCCVPLTRKRQPTPAEALLAWDEVALVERGTPELGYDTPVVYVRATEPEQALAALAPYLPLELPA